MCVRLLRVLLTFIFSKGYEGKGVLEGVRYGFLCGADDGPSVQLHVVCRDAVPYSMAFQGFLYAAIELIICGVVLALVFGKKASAS